MFAGFIGLIIGAIVGGGLAGELGAASVAPLGLFAGLTFHALAWLRAHSGDAPVVERHLVMCTPMGHAARAELVGDLEQRRWHDVRSCSLLAEQDQVQCDKGCVRLMNLSGVRPGAARGCAGCNAGE